MAVRPVFIVSEKKPFYSVWECEFTYNAGFSVSQKRKNITAIHTRYKNISGKKILEISSKSMQDIGVKLSAFNLMKYVPELSKSVPVECVYQGSKVFTHSGPFTDLYEAKPKDAKNDPRIIYADITGFRFDGIDYPSRPMTAFYDFLYISALLENEELHEELLEYDAFTDIEFNPQYSINCQARAAAIFVSLSRCGMLDKCRDYNEFAALFDVSSSLVHPAPKEEDKEDKAELKEASVSFTVGQRIKHPVYGEGCITNVGDTTMKADFDGTEKTLSVKWVAQNCAVV